MCFKSGRIWFQKEGLISILQVYKDILLSVEINLCFKKSITVSPNLPVNTDLISLVTAVYRTITNKDLERTCHPLCVAEKRWNGLFMLKVKSAKSVWLKGFVIYRQQWEQNCKQMSTFFRVFFSHFTSFIFQEFKIF